MDGRKGMILAMCQADRVGGRVQAAGSGALELLDCMEWDDEWTNRLRSQYPDMRVSFRSSRRSLSGFVVRFEVCAGPREWMWHGVIGFVLACCCYVLCSYRSILRGQGDRI